MVISYIQNFFRMIYLFVVDMYNFPDLRRYMLTVFRKRIFERKHVDTRTIYDDEGNPLRSACVKGKFVPDWPLVVDNIDNYDKFHARGDDIWIVNWPKSGTHWMFEVVTCLTSGKAQLHDGIKENTMFPEFCPVDILDDMTSPRILDTHIQLELFPEEALKTSKIIYTVRNPKDAFVSGYFHLSRDNLVGFRGGWNNFFRTSMKEIKEVPYGTWYDHVRGYLAALENKPNALVVKYEDMIKDLKKEVRRIAEFIGHQNSEEFYDEVARVCSFDHMQKSKKELKIIWKPGGSMYRKGIVGDWKNMFTVAQNEEFDAIYKDRLKNLNISIDFELA
ncbi:cytosolic sulfotransferase 1 [Lingula anatina]|uniref:Cytosolic sulfotransferase 1 n=1 Tax=Lingula anatina TaxID=7574 RepID=A0A1S3II42_LINAN|nr:cytosolic sulfotransferase 1 [Lingula anatina]XP_013397551.1 cytosolic sulfotransferase 1 [Lingula anatina]|eukprot:XP_013397550.1 cytosolic sulfotransferase 1 [Lingula anatina]